MKFFEGAGKEDLSSWSRSISVVTCCERSRSLLDEVGRKVVVEEVMKKKESRGTLKKFQVNHFLYSSKTFLPLPAA